jgi:two-component system, NtrC family, sensor kinase
MSWWLDAIAWAAGLAALAAGAQWHRRTSRRLAQGERDLQSKTAELEHGQAQKLAVETRYRTLFDSVPVCIFVSRIDGSVIDVNAAGLQLFGYGRDEFMQLNMRSLYVNPAERDRRMAAAMHETAPHQGEYRLRRKDGSAFPALIQNLIVRDADGRANHVEGFVTDVSEIKRLETERQKAEQEQRISTRLQSVGALAAGIAHEINTPMQFVSDSVYFIKSAIDELDVLWPEIRKLSAGLGSTDAVARIQSAATDIDIDQLMREVDESSERALEGIRRVTKIIRAMHEFAHPDSGEHTLVDINRAIETTLTVCRNVYKTVADVKTEFGDLPQVMCQYGEINQAILNIVVNAVHAIEGRRNQDARGSIRIATRTEDNWAVIAIQDNGTGIPESVKSRIFDPFFTTKEVGKGTGQGLAIVQSVIVGRHKGRISVESEVGAGTTFVLRLPLGTNTSQASGVEHETED